MNARLSASALALALGLLSSVASAQQSPRERFARGVALSAEGDWRTALIEFRAAYDATQNPEVLFNIAAAHEQLNEYVDALDTLERYQRLAPPGAVAQHRAEVVAAMARLVNRIGALRLVTSTPSPRCTVDGVARTTESLREGLRVSAGRRAVRCEATGFQPRELTVDVAPNGVTDALVELVRVRASIAVTADREGAEVRIDDRVVGRTPLAEPVLVDEGAHTVTVSMPGYDPVTREVDARGDRARVEATLRWSDPIPAAVASRLVVRTSETGARASLDGRSMPTDGSMAVPPGRHALRVERENFITAERMVDLTAGGSTSVDVAFEPTPGYRALYLAGARAERRRWIIVGGASLVVAAVGGVMGALYTIPYNDANARVSALNAQAEACQRPSATCEPGASSRYNEQAALAARERDELAAPAWIGAGLLGLGGIGLVTAAILWINADPVDRFERAPTFRVGLGPGGASLEGRF